MSTKLFREASRSNVLTGHALEDILRMVMHRGIRDGGIGWRRIRIILEKLMLEAKKAEAFDPDDPK